MLDVCDWQCASKGRIIASPLLANIYMNELRDTLNSSLLDWSNYFCPGTRRSAFRSIDRYTSMSACGTSSPDGTR
jgi:hypothetical protein